ncbi:MAG: glycerophosphodiester phosphodiesterase [Rhodospirillales bacterium]|nr:glycerophosphodiester phosphodiesterase [Alphaproteobacteria bacterium]MBL6948661.1 glycerophosphodiester phosphodiesterase [Rhodospirillales bacterium]
MPKVCGHRGAAGHAPENTLASIKKAASLGVRWVEFDTKLTADGVAVLFHDDDLGRTTDGAGLMAETSLADVRCLDAGSWFGEEFQGEGVPTLEDAIRELSALGLGANVEIKPSPGREEETARTVAEILADRWPDGVAPPMVSSFKEDVLATVRDTAPGLERALLAFEIPGDWRERLKRLGCVALHVQAKHLMETQVRAVRGEGFALRAFTVNDPTEAEKLLAWGVDGIVSDYPDRILAVAEST